jgi:predicted nuclease of predicted toxin-antitoxin system
MYWRHPLKTKLRAIIDEAVPDPLAREIQQMSGIDAICVREVSAVKGRSDKDVMDYASEQRRIVVTTETAFNERAFPICTHPGIIVISTKSRHESIQQGVFKEFLGSGHRKYAKDSVTYVRQDEALVKSHEGERVYRW